MRGLGVGRQLIESAILREENGGWMKFKSALKNQTWQRSIFITKPVLMRNLSCWEWSFNQPAFLRKGKNPQNLQQIPIYIVRPTKKPALTASNTRPI